ncbi:MAG: AzlD domain-containing protein [Sulfuricaulis sp.]|uniref:AzlD domain-containing protein n=1 Tax=Sulfuricaulis sp. TaxID=2003553 RepID=UPI0034A20476
MSDWRIWLLVLACGAGTYLWRALGVAISGRLRPDSEVFAWITCVAYAMLAGLVARIVILPVGTLAASALGDRLVACALALAVFYLSRRNLFMGVGAGFLVFVALTYRQATFS